MSENELNNTAAPEEANTANTSSPPEAVNTADASPQSEEANTAGASPQSEEANAAGTSPEPETVNTADTSPEPETTNTADESPQPQAFASADVPLSGTNPYAIPADAGNPYSPIPPDKPVSSGSQNSSGKKFIIIGIIAAVVLLLGIGITVAALTISAFSNPKAKVFKGIAKTMNSANMPLTDYLNTDELQKLYLSGIYGTEGYFSLDKMESYYSYDDDFSGMELGFNSRQNAAEEKLSAAVTLSYSGQELLTANIYGYDNMLAADVPDLFSGYFEMPLNDMKNTYADSMFYYYLEDYFETFDDDFRLFPDEDMEAATLDSIFKEKYAEDILAFSKAITVEKADTQNLTIGDATQKCQGYTMILPRQELTAIMIDLMTLAAEESRISPSELNDMKRGIQDIFQEDLTLMVYLDKKGRAVEISYQDTFEADGEEMEVSVLLDWQGSQYLFDDFTADLTIGTSFSEVNMNIRNTSSVKNDETTNDLTAKVVTSYPEYQEWDDEEYEFRYKQTFNSATGSFDFSFVADDISYDYNDLTFKGYGVFQKINDGNGVSFELEDCLIEIDDRDYSLNFSGNYSIAPLTEAVASPAGPSYNLATLTEAELEDLVYEMQENLMSSDLYEFILNY